MAVIIFGLSQQFAHVIKEEGVAVTFEHAETRENFLARYPDADFSNVRGLTYEPSRSLYHITEADYSVTDCGDDPTSDPRMAYIHSNIDDIVTWFDSRYADLNDETLTY